MSSCWVYSYIQGGQTLWGIASNGTMETRTGYFTKDAAVLGMKTWGFCDAILDRPPTDRYISPMGVGTSCNDMIALVYNGKKYWITSEHAALGYPSAEEVSINEFQAIPDGTASITVNGVTISPKDTSAYCGTSAENWIPTALKDWIPEGLKGNSFVYLLVAGIIFYFLFLRRK